MVESFFSIFIYNFLRIGIPGLVAGFLVSFIYNLINKIFKPEVEGGDWWIK